MGFSKFFDPRFKLKAHVAQLILIVIMIALSGAHMNIGVLYGRPEVMTIAMVSHPLLI